jgi:hypothetical protein
MYRTITVVKNGTGTEQDCEGLEAAQIGFIVVGHSVAYCDISTFI